MASVTSVYVDGEAIVESDEYLLMSVEDAEAQNEGEITDEYENILALNPETFAIDRTTHTVRIVSEGFSDVVQEFEYEFNEDIE